MRQFYFGGDDDNPFTSCIGMILQIFMGTILVLFLLCIPLYGIDMIFDTSLVDGFLGWVTTLIGKIGS